MIRSTSPGARVSPDDPSSVSQLGVRVVVVVFLLVAFVHALSPSVQVGDSRLSVPVATQVIRQQNLHLEGSHVVTELDDTYDVRHVDGHTLPFFPWAPMLLAIPGAVAYDLVGRDPGALRPSDPNQTWIIEIPTASLLVAATSVVLMVAVFGAAVGTVSERRRLAVTAALVLAFGTGAWSTGSRALWQHTPSMLCLALALLAALRLDRADGARWAYALGVALAAAYTMRPTNAVALVLILVWVAVTQRPKLGRALVGAAAVGIPFTVVNLMEYGSLLPPYFAGSRLGTETAVGFWEALAMNVVSPSRGLLIYNPIVILAVVGSVAKIRRGAWTSLDSALVAVVAVHWLVIARYGSTGGSAYGSRMWTEVLPIVVYLSVPALRALLELATDRTPPRASLVLGGAVLLLGWSVAVNATGAVLRSGYCWSATPVHVDQDPSRVWDWSDPQFARPYRRALEGASVHDVVLETCGSA